MTLVLRPAGRGNWATVTVTFSGQRATPFTVRVGDPLTVGGITYRVCEVRA